MAVLGDDRPDWRPSCHDSDYLGCRVRFEFPIVKLLDYGKDLNDLERQANPFAAVVLAHLKTLETRKESKERLGWKVRIVRSLFDRGLNAEVVRQLFRLIDWMMELPKELERQFKEEIHRYEEEKKMPYITSVERLAREEGKKEGAIEELRNTLLRLGRKRFGPPEETTLAALQASADLEHLERMSERLLEVSGWAELLAAP